LTNAFPQLSLWAIAARHSVAEKNETQNLRAHHPR
jgi:hypothetical protein